MSENKTPSWLNWWHLYAADRSALLDEMVLRVRTSLEVADRFLQGGHMDMARTAFSNAVAKYAAAVHLGLEESDVQALIVAVRVRLADVGVHT